MGVGMTKQNLLRRLVSTLFLVGMVVFLVPDFFTATAKKDSTHRELQEELSLPAVPEYVEPAAGSRERMVTETLLNIGGKYDKETVSGLDTQGKLKAWSLIAGVNSSQEEAQQLEKSLHGDGFYAYIEKIYRTTNAYDYQVNVGPVLDREEIYSVRDRLQNNYNVTSLQITDWNY